MPQPMSTPTAAGMIAPQRRDDAADRRALAQVGVGHEGQVRVDEGEGGRRDCLGPGVLLEDRCPADQPRAEVLACHEAGAWHGRPRDVAVIPRTPPGRTCHDRRVTDTATLPVDLPAPIDGPPLASWTRRVIAALLDGAILSGATWAVLGSDGSSPSLTPTFSAGAAAGIAWFTSPWLVGLLVAMLALQGWTGATPGKRVAGVAIVRASDGLPVGVLASGLRVVAHLLDAIFLIGYLRPLWNDRKQTFADSIVGTLAVQTREPRGAPVVRAVPARAVCAAVDGGERRCGRPLRARHRVLVDPVRGRLRVRGRRAVQGRGAVRDRVRAHVPARPDVRRPAAVGDPRQHGAGADGTQRHAGPGWTPDRRRRRRAHEIDILDADGAVVSTIEQEVPFDHPARPRPGADHAVRAVRRRCRAGRSSPGSSPTARRSRPAP